LRRGGDAGTLHPRLNENYLVPGAAIVTVAADRAPITARALVRGFHFQFLQVKYISHCFLRLGYLDLLLVLAAAYAKRAQRPGRLVFLVYFQLLKVKYVDHFVFLRSD
jgi:hypothetical protein